MRSPRRAWNLPVDRYGKAVCYCLYTAKQALDDAGLSTRDLAKKRVGVIVGTTMGEIQFDPGKGCIAIGCSSYGFLGGITYQNINNVQNYRNWSTSFTPC